MLELDEQALSDAFWDISLSYTDEDGETVVLSDERKLVVNQPSENIDDTQPWVRFTILPGDSQMDATGTIPTYQQLGTAVLQVFAPKGTGLSAAREIRDQFIAAFRNWTSPDGHCHTYRVNNNVVEQDAYVQLNVTVFWESLRRAT